MRERGEQLTDIVAEQGGFFTAAQARRAGYSYRLQHWHHRAGNWEKVGHGLFRLRHFPLPPRPDLIQWSLWSRNQQGEPQAVVSHESALVLYELSDVMPAKTHLTVPRRFRKPAPTGCVLHRAELKAENWTEQGGYRITTPARTLRDVAGGALSQDLLDQAVSEAIGRGMVREKQLRASLSAGLTLEAASRLGHGLDVYRPPTESLLP